MSCRFSFLVLLLSAGGAFAQATLPVRYAVVGDSYSCGVGATAAQSWPSVLAQSLTQSALPTEIVANPARMGFSSKDALERELPIVQRSKPNFATLMIGANDWFQKVDGGAFRLRIALLLDGLISAVGDKRRVLVVNIPHFGVTPMGKQAGAGRNVEAGIVSFNAIISDEAQKREVTVIDVFTPSKEMQFNSLLVAKDGLHPTAQEYAAWATIVFPVARQALSR